MSTLPPDSAIILGAIRYQQLGGKDKYYKFGDGLDAPAEKQLIYFVGYHVKQPSEGSAQGEGTVLLGWTAYRITKKDGDVAESLSSGVIVLCNHPHHDPPAYLSAGFASCQSKRLATLLGEAQTPPMSTEEVLGRATCHLSDSLASLPDITTRCKKQVDSATAPLLSAKKVQGGQSAADLLKALLAAIDTRGDPYWFSCASGCCTSEES